MSQRKATGSAQPRPTRTEEVLTGDAATLAAHPFRRVESGDLGLAGADGHMFPLLIVSALPQGENLIRLSFSIHEKPRQAPLLCLHFEADYLPEPVALAFGPGETDWVRGLLQHGTFGVSLDPGVEGVQIEPCWYDLAASQREALILFLERVEAWSLNARIGMVLRDAAGEILQ